MSHHPTFFVLGRVEDLTRGRGPFLIDATPMTYTYDFPF